MSVAGLEGLLLGGLIGMLLRPVLDSYLRWRQMQASRSREFEIPTYPFLREQEEEESV